MASYLTSVSNGNIILLSVIGGSFVFLMTSLGNSLAIFAKNVPKWFIDLSLSFSAGIMIVASFTSLLLPAIEISKSFLPIAVGIPLGIVLVYFADKFTPHEHLLKGYEGPKSLEKKLKVVWLLLFTMIIHNLPEGLAVGVSLAGNTKNGLVTTIAIGIQDFPEGIVVALPLAVLQKRILQPMMLSILSGFSELVMAVLGAALVGSVKGFLPYGLALAGGAMLFVTVRYKGYFGRHVDSGYCKKVLIFLI